MSKKTYLTKADAIEFAQFTHSDERRLRLQREARNKFEAGTTNFVPWTVAERIVTNEDFKLWKTTVNEYQRGQIELIQRIKDEFKEAIEKEGDEVLVDVMNILTNLTPLK